GISHLRAQRFDGRCESSPPLPLVAIRRFRQKKKASPLLVRARPSILTLLEGAEPPIVGRISPPSVTAFHVRSPIRACPGAAPLLWCNRSAHPRLGVKPAFFTPPNLSQKSTDSSAHAVAPRFS